MSSCGRRHLPLHGRTAESNALRAPFWRNPEGWKEKRRPAHHDALCVSSLLKTAVNDRVLNHQANSITDTSWWCIRSGSLAGFHAVLRYRTYPFVERSTLNAFHFGYFSKAEPACFRALGRIVHYECYTEGVGPVS